MWIVPCCFVAACPHCWTLFAVCRGERRKTFYLAVLLSGSCNCHSSLISVVHQLARSCPFKARLEDSYHLPTKNCVKCPLKDSFLVTFLLLFTITQICVIEQVSTPVQYICSHSGWQPFERFVSLAKCVTFKALGMCGLLTRNSRVWFLQKTKSMPKGCPALGAFYDTCMETQNWSLQVSLGIPHIYPSSCFLKMQCSWGHLHQLDCLSRDPLWSIGHSDPRINLSA